MSGLLWLAMVLSNAKLLTMPGPMKGPIHNTRLVQMLMADPNELRELLDCPMGRWLIISSRIGVFCGNLASIRSETRDHHSLIVDWPGDSIKLPEPKELKN